MTRLLAFAVQAAQGSVGDITFGDLLRVPLTTVSWSRSEVGREAAELLLNPLEDEDADDEEPRRVIVPPHLVVRESCGGARRSSNSPGDS